MKNKLTNKLSLLRIASLRIASGLSLFCERASFSFWRIDVWLLFFTALWLLQIPALFGNIFSIGTALVFFAGLLYFTHKGAQLFSWPTVREIDRRIESVSKAKHRPLERRKDKLANPQKSVTQKLWLEREATLESEISSLKAPTPRPLLAYLDPKALRIFALLFCLVAIIVSGTHWQDRLAQGLFPFQISGITDTEPTTILWITPPEYTGYNQTIIQGTGKLDTPLNVIEGSFIKARLPKSFLAPALIIAGEKHRYKKEDDGSWSLGLKSKQTETITIKHFPHKTFTAAVNYIKDEAPRIKILEEAKILGKGALQIPVTVQDDFGVTDIILTMDLADSIEDRPLGQPLTITRGILSLPDTETTLNPVYDLTWHPWAGLPVKIIMKVNDFKGQSALAEPLEFLLPEREFYNPAAKQLVEMRKRLLWSPAAAQSNISYELEQIMVQLDSYSYDKRVFLSLRSMASRLIYDPSMDSTIAVIEQLWDTALRIEDGDLTLAARNLREAQKKLEEVLRDPNATNQDVAKAMENLRMAMAQYFQEIARTLQENMRANGQEELAAEMMDRFLNPEDLAAFLDQMQAHALSGDKQSARELLSQLQKMMDNIDQSMSGSGEMPEEMQEMAESMKMMEALIKRQEALLEQTLGLADNAEASAEAAEQEDIRKNLGEIMLKINEAIGKIPDELSKAEREMKESFKQCSANNPSQSAKHQKKALEYLQQGQKNMQQQMQQMMKQMMMMSMGMGQTDPLGRPMNPDGDGESLLPGKQIEIPDKASRKKAREILRTIRQRASERGRPDYELEYYQRLMKQF